MYIKIVLHCPNCLFFRYCLLADLASCLLTFDSESLVPCFLEKVMPMVMNHAEAETILEELPLPESAINISFGPASVSNW